MGHRLVEVHREAGVSETRFHAVCSCGWIGPDHGFSGPPDWTFLRGWTAARTAAIADHKLHSEGKPIGQARDERDLPGAPYRPPDEKR